MTAEQHHHHEVHHQDSEVRPVDLRVHALNQAVTLHTQSLRHLFSKDDDQTQAEKATTEVLATARRFAEWAEHGDQEAEG